MGTFDKLIDEIKHLDKNLRFAELEKVLERIGYTGKQPKGGSSHVTFRKAGRTPITIPKDYPILRAYIELVREAILSYESEEV